MSEYSSIEARVHDGEMLWVELAEEAKINALGIETHLLIEQDRSLHAWMGEILGDKDLYESAEFNWFGWCVDTKNELNERVRQLNLRGVLLEARKAAYEEATTAKITTLEPMQGQASHLTQAA